MHVVRRSEERGHLNFGWLDTYHSFSFGDYWDRKWMGFAHLRVINEDRIDPGQGFPTHPHRDMEIVTIILSGALAHKDSMGTGSTIYPGDVQRMTAGSGILHSEFNASQTEECHLLQIWILPEEQTLTPEYDQKTFDPAEKLNKLMPVVSNDGRDGSMKFHQQAVIYSTQLEPGKSLSHQGREGRAYWLQMLKGKITIEGEELLAGDALGMSQMSSIAITAVEESEFLLFEMW